MGLKEKIENAKPSNFFDLSKEEIEEAMKICANCKHYDMKDKLHIWGKDSDTMFRCKKSEYRLPCKEFVRYDSTCEKWEKKGRGKK